MPHHPAAFAAIVITLAAQPSLGWDAHGHRTITLLALDQLPGDVPQWMRDPEVRARIAEQSNEADRWRGTRLVPIGHEVNPEHYIDVEDLEPFGLTLQTLSPYRYEAFRAMAVARDRNPDRFPVVSGADRDRTKEWPGFLPWAIQEHHAKLRASFSTYRILEELNDPARALQLEQARQNCIYQMGMLSHFVGDAAQPLHTTRHHHGWVGENPAGYSTEFGIHAFIDGAIVAHHGFDYESLCGVMPEPEAIEQQDAWAIALGAIQRSFEQVEPLYRMEKDGSIREQPGRDMIGARLCDGAATLGTLYSHAWNSAKPTQQDVSTYLKFADPRPRPAQEPAVQR